MQTNRETKELKTGVNTLVVKTYITGGEMNEIEDMLLDKMSLNNTSGKVEVQTLNGKMLREQRNKLIELVVVSVNGVAENILEAVKNLPYDEYKKVTDYVESLGGMGKEVASS